MSRSCGFTLLELIVILTIIAILSVFAIGRFADNASFNARGYHDELVSATRFAQRYAVASGCAVQIDIQPATYSLTLANPCPSPGTPVQRPDGGNFAGNAPAGVTTGGDTGTYTFDAWGDVDSGGTISVSGGSGSHAFTLTADSGFVDLP